MGAEDFQRTGDIAPGFRHVGPGLLQGEGQAVQLVEKLPGGASGFPVSRCFLRNRSASARVKGAVGDLPSDLVGPVSGSHAVHIQEAIIAFPFEFPLHEAGEGLSEAVPTVAEKYGFFVHDFVGRMGTFEFRGILGFFRYRGNCYRQRLALLLLLADMLPFSPMVQPVVVDTSVFISALIGARGPSREILKKMPAGPIPAAYQ